MFSTQEIVELVKAGVSPAEIVELQQASSSAGAESTVAAPPPTKPVTPDWIVQHGINKAARRTLAAQMRASKTPITPASWKKAKKAAGIK